MRLRATACLLIAIAAPVGAQEPQPAIFQPNLLTTAEGIDLSLAWRYAPGDDPSRGAANFDDSRWTTTVPGRPQPWNGVGWFRRHIVLARELQHRPLAVCFASPGAADVYLDGALILSSARGGAAPLVPWQRRDARVVRLNGTTHVFAVRYVYPVRAVADGNFGFRLTLANPALRAAPAAQPPIENAVEGAFVALPFFIALLHFALFAFDRRARENLFYACEMLAFAGVVFHDFNPALVTSDVAQTLIERLTRGSPFAAIFFGLMTYYAVRAKRIPRAWIGFAIAGAILFASLYIAPAETQYAWMGYFLAMCIELFRLERSDNIAQREGSRFFVVSFTLFGITVVFQALIDYGILTGIGQVTQVYLFGLLASMTGMSLYLARRLGQSRLVEIENARKSAELAQARELQLSMLPRELPSARGLDVAAMTQTAAEVGGDYYDVRRDGDESLLFAFGDATGHGLPSGVVVTAAKALFTAADPARPIGDLLADCARAMRSMDLPSLRMCLMLARVSSREVSVVSAAMPPVLVHRHASGNIEELGRGGLPLGGRLFASYESVSAPLGPGDTLLFASDGFAELSSSDGHLLGYDGVARAFTGAVGSGCAREIVDRLLAAAATFRGAEPQADDITFVVVRVGGD